MSVHEIGHASWSRPDADRVAWALLDQDDCTSVQLVPPQGPCDGWSVRAIYDEAAPLDGLARCSTEPASREHR